MLVSFTLGAGALVALAIAALWGALVLWPYPPEQAGGFGIGNAIDGFFRVIGGLAGTVVLLLAYIALKAWGF